MNSKLSTCMNPCGPSVYPLGPPLLWPLVFVSFINVFTLHTKIKLLRLRASPVRRARWMVDRSVSSAGRWWKSVGKRAKIMDGKGIMTPSVPLLTVRYRRRNSSKDWFNYEFFKTFTSSKGPFWALSLVQQKDRFGWGGEGGEVMFETISGYVSPTFSWISPELKLLLIALELALKVSPWYHAF